MKAFTRLFRSIHGLMAPLRSAEELEPEAMADAKREDRKLK